MYALVLSGFGTEVLTAMRIQMHFPICGGYGDGNPRQGRVGRLSQIQTQPTGTVSGGGGALIGAAGSHITHRFSPYMTMFDDICNLIKSMNNMTPGCTYMY